MTKFLTQKGAQIVSIMCVIKKLNESKCFVDCEIGCENTEALTILECEYTDDKS